MIENVMGGKIWLKSKPGVGTTVYFTLSFPKARRDLGAATVQVVARDPVRASTNKSDTDTETESDYNFSDNAAAVAANTTAAAAVTASPRLTKPVAAARADGHATTPTSGPAGSPHVDLSRIPRPEIRICIAEDNPVNQKIAVSFVKKLGFQSEAFSDGLQAVEALRQRSRDGRPFHLVLMDVQMPVLDGYEATRTIRRDSDPHVRGVLVIAMTASAIRGDREKCLEAGMNNYLAKPVRAAVLKDMLDEYLSRASSQMEPVKLESMAREVVREVAKESESEIQGQARGVDGGSGADPDGRPQANGI